MLCLSDICGGKWAFGMGEVVVLPPPQHNRRESNWRLITKAPVAGRIPILRLGSVNIKRCGEGHGRHVYDSIAANCKQGHG
jgi:hypothetical protein